MRYEGTVYRPPSEARSLIVQLTIGCAHNACTFCTMYKDKKFRIRSLEEIKKDFAKAFDLYGDHIERIFLADGDALVIDTTSLLEILNYIRGLFPSVKRIASYGTPGDVNERSLAELGQLKKAGLEMIYLGVESGDAQVLEEVCKGATREEIIMAGQKLKSAGMKTSVTLISGLGGKERLKEHAQQSASLISEIKPDFVGFLTLVLEPAAPIYKKVQSGRLQLLSPEEVMEEMELFLEHVDSDGTVFRSNHASNYVMLKGTLNEDIPQMISYLHTVKEERRFRKENHRKL